jgi:hypothetical protein
VDAIRRVISGKARSIVRYVSELINPAAHLACLHGYLHQHA